MGVMRPLGVGTNQGPDQNHRGTGGSDDARHQCAERKYRRVHQWGAGHVAGDQDAARHGVEREQQHDEAQILGQHRVHEGSECSVRAIIHRDRRKSQHRPAGGELAVVAVPDFW